jgi:hypothetical protein
MASVQPAHRRDSKTQNRRSAVRSRGRGAVRWRITEQVPRDRVVWECLDDLPGDPDGRGVVRDAEMDEFAAVVAEHDENEQKAEGQGRHKEEVHGDNRAGMRMS